MPPRDKTMQLKDLYQDFNELSEEQQLHFFERYYLKRNQDLSKQVIIVKRKAQTRKKRDKKIPVTPEQVTVLRKLGLI